MNQDDVLQLFVKEAENLDMAHNKRLDTIRQLAQLIADTRESLSEDSFAALVRIGATIYKAKLSQNRARNEIATTMRESLDSGKD